MWRSRLASILLDVLRLKIAASGNGTSTRMIVSYYSTGPEHSRINGSLRLMTSTGK